MKLLKKLLEWLLSWRTISNGLLIAAFITAYGGDDIGAIFLLALAILTRLWHQEELRKKTQ